MRNATLGNSGKYKIDVGAVFGGYFVKGNFFAFSIVQSSLFGDGSGVLHIDLVSHNHRYDICFVVLLYFRHRLLMSLSSESRLSKVLYLVTS